MKKVYRIPLFVLIALLVLVLAACGGEDPTPEPTAVPPTTAPTDIPPTAVPPTDIPPTELPPTATPEPEPTAVPVAALTDFSDEATGISIGYPDSWVTDGADGFYIFASNADLLDTPDPGEEGAVAMLIMIDNAEMESDDPIEAIGIFADSFGEDGKMTMDGEATAVSINGYPGATASLSGTTDSGTAVVGNMSIVIGDIQTAILVGMTPTETGDEYLPAFAAMQDSIMLSDPVVAVGTETTASIAVGDTVDGSIDSNGRSLWTFKAKSGDYIYITVTPDDTFDAVVDIIDENGDSVLPTGEVDDSFGEEVADVMIPADGEYTISVGGFGDSSGNFQLALGTTLDNPVTGADGSISQWASSAVASSEFSTDSWAAYQAEGAPDTFECGDLTTAWAAANSDSVEWIELYYDVPVQVTEINIYQSYNPDQVVAVELLAVDGGAVQIYEQAQVAEESCPYILSLAVESDFASEGVRITIDQSAFSDWTEIDAVELVGTPVDGAVSSTSNTAGDSAENVLWRVGGVSGYDGEDAGYYSGIAFDAGRDRLYVSDSFNGIVVMNSNGDTLDLFTTDSAFFSPNALDLDAAGNIYAANDSFDDEEGRIVVFSPEGDVIAEFGGSGTGDGEFGILSPSALAVAADGTTYALDSNEDDAGESVYRIQKFAPDGTFEAIIPISDEYSMSYDTPITIDSEGFLYIADWLNGNIIKMDDAGNVVQEISRGGDFYYDSIQDLVVDDNGIIYAVIWGEPAIITLDQEGNMLSAYGAEAEDGASVWPMGSFYWPNALALSPSGDTVFVSDWSGDYAYVTAVDMRE